MIRPIHMFSNLLLAWRGRIVILATLLVAALSAASTHAAGEQILKLRDPAQAATAEGRQLVKYLVSCALPAGVVVEVKVNGELYRYPGGMGLVPAWAQRDLIESEQRLVSACILARTNFYGKTVKISTRSNRPDPPQALTADETEQREYPFYEGAFFGNLFKPGSPAFVCQGKVADGERKQILERTLRICSLPNQKGLPRQFSNCGFIIVGECGGDSYVQNGVDYSAEAIHIHLQMAPEVLASGSLN